jgi:DNA (cytosine-5)-methyltransferase 1
MPLLLDFFCCEGGSAMGYHEAGFDIIGIDDKPQPRYPFAFIQCDFEAVDPRLIRLADALHGSPPCQFGSEVTPEDKRKNHVNLIPQTRRIFRDACKPYVIENVRKVAALHLHDPVMLFGTMFGNHLITSKGQKFVLSRERGFENNWGLTAPPDPGTGGYPIANVFGGHLRARSGEYRTGGNTGKTVDFPGEDRPALARQLMQMPWATMNGMTECVPPSMSRYIGEQLREFIGR